MAKLAGAAADRELAAAMPRYRAYLLYGPDTGLVQERAELLVRRVVADPSDPFNVSVYTERDVLEDPVRLADDLAARSLLGGRRVVRVREAGDQLAAKLKDGRLPVHDEDALLVVEAGDLPSRSSLRKLFEEAPDAAAIGCYPDEGAALDRLIDSTLGEAGLSLSRDARALLKAMLGADRLATRSELAKLRDYMANAPGGHVDVDDVLAVVADEGTPAVDSLAYAALCGEVASALDQCRRLEAEGTSAVTLLRGLARIVSNAMAAADRVEQGMSPGEAVKSLRPPVFFRDQPKLEKVLARHRLSGLRRIQQAVWEAEKQAKSTGFPDMLVAAQLVLRIAVARGA
jgi:DNA polymerase-3 subunit delta